MSMAGLRSKARISRSCSVIRHLFDRFNLVCRMIVMNVIDAVILVFTFRNSDKYMVRLIETFDLWR